MRRSAIWVIGLLGTVAMVAVAAGAWLIFTEVDETARYWPDAQRQAAYGLTMLHMPAALGIAYLWSSSLKWLLGDLKASERFADEFFVAVALWGAALPFIVIGERFAQTHVGGAVLGLITMVIVLATAHIARRLDREISTWLVWAPIGVFYLIHVYEETGYWTSPASTAGYVMLIVGGAWESWLWYERKLWKAPQQG